MTAVIGIIAQNAIVMVSDGFGLTQDAPGAAVLKQDDCSKLQLLQDGGLILGYSGSYNIAVELTGVPKSRIETGFQLCPEIAINSLGSQLAKLNSQGPQKAIVMVGSYHQNAPRLQVIEASGRIGATSPVLTLGSGADALADYVWPRWSEGLSAASAAELAITAVYYAARVPTVNFLPMVAYLTPSGGRDLTQYSVSEFRRFQESLLRRIVSMVSE